VHAVASVCCYRGWLAKKLTIPNKDIFDFQILVNFLIINALPLIEIRFTVFGMVPILLVSTYLQVTVQAHELKEMYMYLPDEIKAKHRRPEELVSSTMFRTFTIGAMFILAHYLQHLDLSRLTIKTHLIKKEQDSLSSYFEANKDGVLIYFNKSEPKNASRTEENQTTTPADSFSPSVVLRNSAALQIIGGDLENLTEI